MEDEVYKDNPKKRRETEDWDDEPSDFSIEMFSSIKSSVSFVRTPLRFEIGVSPYKSPVRNPPVSQSTPTKSAVSCWCNSRITVYDFDVSFIFL